MANHVSKGLLEYFRDTCTLHEYFYFAIQLDFLEIHVALFIVFHSIVVIVFLYANHMID